MARRLTDPEEYEITCEVLTVRGFPRRRSRGWVESRDGLVTGVQGIVPKPRRQTVFMMPSAAQPELPAHLSAGYESGMLNRARLLEAIAFQSEVAGAGAGANATIRVVTERAQYLTDAEGAVFELADGDEMISRAVTGAAEHSLGALLKATARMSRLAISNGEVQTCADSEVDVRVDRKACRRDDVRSILCVPVSHRCETVGVLTVFSSCADAFDETDVAVLRLLGGTIAAAMTQAQLIEQLGAIARAGALTGLPDRRAFEEEAGRQLAFARRQGHSLCFGLLDFDHVNRTDELHGRTPGNRLPHETAARWRGVLRTEDLLGRWRDEQLAILLPNCTTKNAVQFCWRLREEAPGEAFSAGLVAYHGTETLQELVARAGACLGRAKAKGRDRTVAEGLVDLD
jgi:diguanylate cyclase (GGDEF)-like protein